MLSSLPAQVFADQIEIRFPFSGFASQVFKKAGDTVKKGDALAQLDIKILQTELDKELSDYEKIRAGFEIFTRDHPVVTDDHLKFLKTIEQAELNASVKSVELAKMRLDQARLDSPITGIIVSDGGCRSGLFATPSSNSFTVLDSDSLRLRAELELDQLPQFTQLDQTSFSYQDIPLTPSPILPLGKKFVLDLFFSERLALVVGSQVEVILKPQHPI